MNLKTITFTLITLFITSYAIAQSPCENGYANGFPCDGYVLQSTISLAEMDADLLSDVWGWTDPQEGNEYAIIAVENGLVFIDISNPIDPIYVGKLLLPEPEGIGSFIRDVKIYNNFAFATGIIPNHGVQVFDLTRLRDVSNPPVEFLEDTNNHAVSYSKNIAINQDSGYAYILSSDLHNGGVTFINIQDPLNPIVEGGYTPDINFVDDAQVVIYNGPDTEHVGKEILVGINLFKFLVVDVTDKSNPILLSDPSYSQASETAHTWFTEDQRYLIVSDIGDENDFGFNTRTLVFDVEDLDNPQLEFEYTGTTGASDGAAFIVGDTCYLVNRTAGMRVLDISDIANGTISEIGYFDSFPNHNFPWPPGAMGVYPFFESGNIVIGDTQAGLVLVKDENLLGQEEFDQETFSIFPNPASNTLTISANDTGVSLVEIFNALGQKVLHYSLDSEVSTTVDISSIAQGVYLVKINNAGTKKLIVK